MTAFSDLSMPRNIAPIRLDELKDDPVARSLLIEERRQTRFARRAIRLCVLALAAFVVWASFAPVPEVVTAGGELQPSARVRQVQHLEGGIVDAVLVSPGDAVGAGQPLVRLDDAQLRAQLAQARARLDALRLGADRLRALATGDVVELARAGALGEIIDSQREAWRGAQLHAAAQLEVLQAERAANEARLPTVVRQRASAADELALMRERLDLQETSLASGYGTRGQRDDAARAVLEIERDIAGYDSAEAEIGSALAGIAAREAELAARLKSEALEEVAGLEAERLETEAQARQIADRLQRLEIVAPVDGRVHVLNVDGPREVIPPGGAVAEIVPGGGEIFAHVEVPAEEVGGVEPGMPARVRVLTYDYTRFGAIDATVDRVSPSSVVKEDGRRVFEARLRLERDHVGPDGAGLLARPGLTVSADITVGSKTVMEYLLKPLRVVQDRSLTEG